MLILTQTKYGPQSYYVHWYCVYRWDTCGSTTSRIIPNYIPFLPPILLLFVFDICSAYFTIFFGPPVDSYSSHIEVIYDITYFRQTVSLSSTVLTSSFLNSKKSENDAFFFDA